jgi:hypothetical protein
MFNPQRRHVRREDATQVAASFIIYHFSAVTGGDNEGRALARLAMANCKFAKRTRRRATPFDGRQREMMQLRKMKHSFS